MDLNRYRYCPDNNRFIEDNQIEKDSLYKKQWYFQRTSMFGIWKEKHWKSWNILDTINNNNDYWDIPTKIKEALKSLLTFIKQDLQKEIDILSDEEKEYLIRFLKKLI